MANNTNNNGVIVIYDSDDDESVVCVGEFEPGEGETSDSEMESAPQITNNQTAAQPQYEVVEYETVDCEIPRPEKQREYCCTRDGSRQHTTNKIDWI